MKENLKLVQDIMLKAIKITTTQNQDVSFEFFPLLGVLAIAIHFQGECSRGLTKSWSVNVKEPGCLDEVLQDLIAIEETKDTSNVQDDFLGGAD
ncbi:hypothetical protein [Clostridium sp. FP1]|uniref:hypothetical protein n=1 Tax=Clostridium sp. FP1 TaxID=2724076 RepID=UPI0013E90B33|nr:hypothetical protein [Clostridium sp. FP1]MBZ9633040.1 hypothetical protein [Clostridium sp. FP1]